MSTSSSSPAGSNFPGAVVVALGATGGESAIAFGVRVARLSGAELELVHVVEPLVGVPEIAVLAEFDVENAGTQVMQAAVDRVRAAEPDLKVSGTVLIGNPVSSLVKNTTDAMMVVLEHRDLNVLARLVIRSISSSVAARAKVPVISVPEGWESRPGAPVTVAVDEPSKAGNLVRMGAWAAASLETELQVLNVWQLPAGYAGVLLSEEDDATLAARSQAEIRDLLATAGAVLEGVDVTVKIERGRPADALLEASRSSALVVMGRHDPARGIGSHLGPVARNVVRSAHSPVMLVGLND